MFLQNTSKQTNSIKTNKSYHNNNIPALKKKKKDEGATVSSNSHKAELIQCYVTRC